MYQLLSLQMRCDDITFISTEMDDYVRQLTPITFPPGSASGTERCLGVTRLNDDIPEPEEHFSIHLSSSTCMLDPAWATVTIVGTKRVCNKLVLPYSVLCVLEIQAGKLLVFIMHL